VEAASRSFDREYWKASVTPAAIDDKGSPNQALWLLLVAGRIGWTGRSGIAAASMVNTWWCSLTRISCFVRTGMKREEVNETGHPTDVFKWIAIAREMAARRV
jgi:hypothetical protein